MSSSNKSKFCRHFMHFRDSVDTRKRGFVFWGWSLNNENTDGGTNSGRCLCVSVAPHGIEVGWSTTAHFSNSLDSLNLCSLFASEFTEALKRSTSVVLRLFSSSSIQNGRKIIQARYSAKCCAYLTECCGHACAKEVQKGTYLVLIRFKVVTYSCFAVHHILHRPVCS